MPTPEKTTTHFDLGEKVYAMTIASKNNEPYMLLHCPLSGDVEVVIPGHLMENMAFTYFRDVYESQITVDTVKN